MKNIITLFSIFVLINSLNVLYAEKVTLLISATLFKAAGGKEGVVADLKREKNIDVTVITAAYGKLKDKAVLSFVAGGGQFDVVSFIDTWINEETIVFMEPLDSMINNSPSFDYNDIIESLRNTPKIPKNNGSIYGIPYRVGTGMFYYRKDIFKKAGVVPPKTWNQFLEIVPKVHETGKVYGVVQRGKKGVSVDQDFLRYMFSTGHGVLSDDNKKCLLDQKDSIEMLEIFAKSYFDGYAPPDMLAWDRDKYRNAMMQGRAAMGLYFSPYWGLLTNPKKSKTHDKLGWFLVPTKNGMNRGTTLNSPWFFIMDKKSKVKKAAWEVVMALTNKTNQLKGALYWANGPIRTSVYNNSEYQDKFPLAKDWLTSISRGMPAAQHPRASEIQDITSTAVINYLQKNKTAEATMKDACRQINSLIN